MKNKIILQKSRKWGNEFLTPFDPDSKDFVRELKENQPIECVIKTLGARKRRSLIQFHLFHAALRVVAFNAFDWAWSTLDMAKISLKVELKYYDKEKAVVLPDGTVVIPFRSFGYDSLPHMEANQVFDRSWPILAGVIGVDEAELIRSAKAKEY